LECQPLGLAVKRHQTKFADNLAKLTAKATKAAIACRYGVNGNGTATDYDTGLVWEQKADDGSVHDKDNMYILTIEIAGIPPNGTAFTDFLGTLNNCVDDGTDPPTGVIGGFAGHCDWRLPSIVELEGIVDLNATGCGSGSRCIDQTVFGPKGVDTVDWSATTVSTQPVGAWFVVFNGGSVDNFTKNDAAYWPRCICCEIPRHWAAAVLTAPQLRAGR